jgi:hypothetical protein
MTDQKIASSESKIEVARPIFFTSCVAGIKHLKEEP